MAGFLRWILVKCNRDAEKIHLKSRLGFDFKAMRADSDIVTAAATVSYSSEKDGPVKEVDDLRQAVARDASLCGTSSFSCSLPPR